MSAPAYLHGLQSLLVVPFDAPRVAELSWFLRIIAHLKYHQSNEIKLQVLVISKKISTMTKIIQKIEMPCICMTVWNKYNFGYLSVSLRNVNDFGSCEHAQFREIFLS